MASSHEMRVSILEEEKTQYGDYTCFKEEIRRRLSATSPNMLLVNDTSQNILWTKSLPMRVLYEQDGIRLYESITYDPGYYLHREELQLLQQYADQIVRSIDNTAIPESTTSRETPSTLPISYIDMGAGRTDKALELLCATLSAKRALQEVLPDQLIATYCAIDLQSDELHRRILHLEKSLDDEMESRQIGPWRNRIAVKGVCGSYFDALQEIMNSQGGEADTKGVMRLFPTVPHDPCIAKSIRCYLWLGSSITNMASTESVDFLRRLRDEYLRPGDRLLIGADTCQNVSKVSTAYSEHSHQWQRYISNGMKNASIVLQAGEPLANSEYWEYVARWDAQGRRHMRFARSRVDGDIRLGPGKYVRLAKGEHILVGESHKFSSDKLKEIVHRAGMEIVDTWMGPKIGSDACLLLLRINSS